jgi:hypothetical protein
MDIGMFCRKYEFFKETDRKENAKYGSHQTQQKNRDSFGKKQFIDQKIF